MRRRLSLPWSSGCHEHSRTNSSNHHGTSAAFFSHHGTLCCVNLLCQCLLALVSACVPYTVITAHQPTSVTSMPVSRAALSTCASWPVAFPEIEPRAHVTNSKRLRVHHLKQPLLLSSLKFQQPLLKDLEAQKLNSSLSQKWHVPLLICYATNLSRVTPKVWSN